MIRLLAAMIVLTGLFAAAPASASAPPPASPRGDWLTGQGGAVVRIGPCNDGGALCGHIVGLMLDPGMPMPEDYRGHTQCGFQLILPSTREGRLWHGMIVDPRNGNHYHAQFHVTRSGNLALRGYILVPILGESQYWTRYRGAVPPSCRITQEKAPHRSVPIE